MASFTDKKSHCWTIDFTVGTARRAKSKLGADFLKPPPPPKSRAMPAVAPAAVEEDEVWPVTRLSTDAWFLVDVLFLACEEEAGSLNVDAEEFAERLSGGPLKAAHDALMESLELFFQSLGWTPTVEMIGRNRQILTQAMEVGATKVRSAKVDWVIQKQMAGLDERMEEMIDLIPGPSSTSLPAPSGSTPTHSRSGA